VTPEMEGLNDAGRTALRRKLTREGSVRRGRPKKGSGKNAGEPPPPSLWDIATG